MKTYLKKILVPLLKSKPDFLIVGAQKSGTTSLYRYLAGHPSILPNKTWKEVHYYNNPNNYKKGLSWYLNHFPFKYQKHRKLTFEATPEYLYYPHIPSQIMKDLGKIKIIIILRNPPDRAYSAWHMYHSFKNNPHQHLRKLYDDRSFSEAIEQELSGNTFSENYPYHYIDRGKYSSQIINYYAVFDKKSVMVLNFDHLKTQLKQLMNEVCDFLDIGRFEEKVLDGFQSKQYNVGNYQKNQDDMVTIEKLSNFFAPHNTDLFNLIGENFNWVA